MFALVYKKPKEGKKKKGNNPGDCYDDNISLLE
jgi:hypothetical protein